VSVDEGFLPLHWLHLPRRNADDRGTGSDSGNDHGACPDKTAGADFDVLYYRGAGTDVGAAPDRHATTQYSAGGDMGMGSDDAIMIDPGSGVDDGVFADPATGLYDGAGHDLGALGNLHIRRHEGPRVDDGYEDKPEIVKTLEYRDSRIGSSGRAYSVYQSDRVPGVTRQNSVITQHRHSQDPPSDSRSVGIDHSLDLETGLLEGGEHDLGMATGADDDYRQGHR
jgi:hypothetical protein